MKVETQIGSLVVSAPMSNEPIQFSVMDAGSFGDNGIYLCRPETRIATNVYMATISTEPLINSNDKLKNNFHPSFQALVRKNDRWVPIVNQENSDFWIDEQFDGTNYSIAWYLRETAPAAVYGVRCIYEDEDYDEPVNVEFQVLYTEYWTYIKVVNDDGNREINNFYGGSEKTLYLNVTFNDGAADPSLAYSQQTTGSTGVRVGAITDYNNIVSLDTMDVTIKTVSGKVYPAQSLQYEIDCNRIALRFLDNLENDIYLVQFTSKANDRIIGQFVIDNTAANGGVNLSHLWVVLMIFGGLLALGAASAYLIPLLIARINEIRVERETERIDRIKNPEKYAKKNKKSFKDAVSDVIYKIKTPAYKRKKQQEEKDSEQQGPVEEKVYDNRFTEMLRERQEKRQFMREHNVTSAEMEKMKEAEAMAAADEANSFAGLRDGDDEIATFHAAKDETPTLETGSYVKDGTTFAQLDSMRENEHPQDNGNNDGK